MVHFFLLPLFIFTSPSRSVEFEEATSEAATRVVTSRSDRSTLPPPYDASCEWTKSSNFQVVVSLQVFLIVSTFLVCIGLLGNVASLIVFSSSEMRKMSSSVYLFLLSVSDSFYLACIFCTKTFNILRCWNISELSHDLRNYSHFCCVFFQYLLDLTADYSSCLILLFTLERFTAVYWPVSFKEICTVKRARIAAGATFAVVAISIGPPHPYLIRLYSDYNICAMSNVDGVIFYNLYILEMVFYRVLPAFVISILNGFIVAKVAEIARTKRKRKQMENSTTVAFTSKALLPVLENHKDEKKKKANVERNDNKAGRSKEFVDEARVGKSYIAREEMINTAVHQTARRQTRRTEDRNLQLTIILILVSTTYILAYLPTLIHFIFNFLSYWNFISIGDEARMIARNYTDRLYVSAFATNFFLFTMSGRVFRRQMWKIFFRTNRSNCFQRQRLI